MFRYIAKEVKAMANVIRNSVTKFNLDTLTDEEVNTIITNTEANIASITAFHDAMVTERERREARVIPTLFST